jgi:hypothetical protein
MELQELVERIQRWRARQEGVNLPEPAAAAPPLPAAEPEESVQEFAGEEELSDLGVEPDASMSEEATSEVALEQIEEAD